MSAPGRVLVMLGLLACSVQGVHRHERNKHYLRLQVQGDDTTGDGDTQAVPLRHDDPLVGTGGKLQRRGAVKQRKDGTFSGSSGSAGPGRRSQMRIPGTSLLPRGIPDLAGKIKGKFFHPLDNGDQYPLITKQACVQLNFPVVPPFQITVGLNVALTHSSTCKMTDKEKEARKEEERLVGVDVKAGGDTSAAATAAGDEKSDKCYLGVTGELSAGVNMGFGSVYITGSIDLASSDAKPCTGDPAEKKKGCGHEALVKAFWRRWSAKHLYNSKKFRSLMLLRKLGIKVRAKGQRVGTYDDDVEAEASLTREAQYAELAHHANAEPEAATVNNPFATMVYQLGLVWETKYYNRFLESLRKPIDTPRCVPNMRNLDDPQGDDDDDDLVIKVTDKEAGICARSSCGLSDVNKMKKTEAKLRAAEEDISSSDSEGSDSEGEGGASSPTKGHAKKKSGGGMFSKAMGGMKKAGGALKKAGHVLAETAGVDLTSRHSLDFAKALAQAADVATVRRTFMWYARWVFETAYVRAFAMNKRTADVDLFDESYSLDMCSTLPAIVHGDIDPTKYAVTSKRFDDNGKEQQYIFADSPRFLCSLLGAGSHLSQPKTASGASEGEGFDDADASDDSTSGAMEDGDTGPDAAGATADAAAGGRRRNVGQGYYRASWAKPGSDDDHKKVERPPLDRLLSILPADGDDGDGDTAFKESEWSQSAQWPNRYAVPLATANMMPGLVEKAKATAKLLRQDAKQGKVTAKWAGGHGGNIDAMKEVVRKFMTDVQAAAEQELATRESGKAEEQFNFRALVGVLTGDDAKAVCPKWYAVERGHDFIEDIATAFKTSSSATKCTYRGAEALLPGVSFRLMRKYAKEIEVDLERTKAARRVKTLADTDALKEGSSLDWTAGLAIGGTFGLGTVGFCTPDTNAIQFLAPFISYSGTITQGSEDDTISAAGVSRSGGWALMWHVLPNLGFQITRTRALPYDSAAEASAKAVKNSGSIKDTVKGLTSPEWQTEIECRVYLASASIGLGGSMSTALASPTAVAAMGLPEIVRFVHAAALALKSKFEPKAIKLAMKELKSMTVKLAAGVGAFAAMSAAGNMMAKKLASMMASSHVDSMLVLSIKRASGAGVELADSDPLGGAWTAELAHLQILELSFLDLAKPMIGYGTVYDIGKLLNPTIPFSIPEPDPKEDAAEVAAAESEGQPTELPPPPPMDARNVRCRVCCELMQALAAQPSGSGKTERVDVLRPNCKARRAAEREECFDAALRLATFFHANFVDSHSLKGGALHALAKGLGMKETHVLSSSKHEFDAWAALVASETDCASASNPWHAANSQPWCTAAAQCNKAMVACEKAGGVKHKNDQYGGVSGSAYGSGETSAA